MTPEIKIIAVSNVYCRLMNFKKSGDVEYGHYHDYDHATLISSGKVLVEILDEEDNVRSSKEFSAPNMAFISKDEKHRITSLEDNTVAVCIHALRTIDEEIVPPDFLIDQKELSDNIFTSSENRPTIGQLFDQRGLKYKTLAKSKK